MPAYERQGIGQRSQRNRLCNYQQTQRDPYDLFHLGQWIGRDHGDPFATPWQWRCIESIYIRLCLWAQFETSGYLQFSGPSHCRCCARRIQRHYFCLRTNGHWYVVFVLLSVDRYSNTMHRSVHQAKHSPWKARRTTTRTTVLFQIPLRMCSWKSRKQRKMSGKRDLSSVSTQNSSRTFLSIRYLVNVSYLEIYNEEIRDLLGKDRNRSLDVNDWLCRMMETARFPL